MHDRRWGAGLDVRVPEGPVMIRIVPVQWLLEGHHGGHESFDTSQLGTWVLGTSPLPGPVIGPLKMREARRPLGPTQSDSG